MSNSALYELATVASLQPQITADPDHRRKFLAVADDLLSAINKLDAAGYLLTAN